MVAFGGGQVVNAFALVPPVSLNGLGGTRGLDLLGHCVGLVPDNSSSRSPSRVSLLTSDKIPILGVSTKRIAHVGNVVSRLARLAVRTSSSRRAPRVRRIRTSQSATNGCVIHHILSCTGLPLTTRHATTRQVRPTLHNCHSFTGLPATRRARIVGNLLVSLTGPRFTSSMIALRLTPCVTRLQQLGSHCTRLTTLHSGSESMHARGIASGRLSSRTRSLLSSVYTLTGTSDLLRPSRRTHMFIHSTARLFTRMQATCGRHSGNAPSKPTRPNAPRPNKKKSSRSPSRV